jgi:LacI family transcriptional regulator
MPARVALLIETSNRYARDLLHGIHDWVAANERWSIRLAAPGPHRASLDWLKTWHGDGVIARVDSEAIASALKRSALPVVDVSAERRRSPFPRISINNRSVAQLAADHLLSKRFPTYAYCGDDRFLWSRQRGGAFVRLVRERGAPCYEFQLRSQSARRGAAPLIAWLRSLPKPVAIFACYDPRAHELIEACHDAGFNVPNDVAILGVDDDELICEFSDPPLSSVLPNARRTGYEAAALLSRLMTPGSAAALGRPEAAGRASAGSAAGGGRAPREDGAKPGAVGESNAPPEIDPIRVVERQSTDTDAVPDAHVVAALRYIRAHACDGINVADVLRAVPISRTLLERKFEQFVGDSPHRLIKRRQIERVCQLLTESDLSIAMIADMTGFESASYLSSVFRREMQTTPREYRDAARAR